jgi:hypothetical protein
MIITSPSRRKLTLSGSESPVGRTSSPLRLISSPSSPARVVPADTSTMPTRTPFVFLSTVRLSYLRSLGLSTFYLSYLSHSCGVPFVFRSRRTSAPPCSMSQITVSPSVCTTEFLLNANSCLCTDRNCRICCDPCLNCRSVRVLYLHMSQAILKPRLSSSVSSMMGDRKLASCCRLPHCCIALGAF